MMKKTTKRRFLKMVLVGLVGACLYASGGTAQATVPMVDLQSPAFAELVTTKATEANFDPDLIRFIAESGNPGGTCDTANVFCLPEEQIICNPDTGEYQKIREVFPNFDSDVAQNVNAAIVLLEELRAQDPAMFARLQERWLIYKNKTTGKHTF